MMGGKWKNRGSSRRIVVIAADASVRETLRTVLASRYEVRVVDPADGTARPCDYADADLIIAGETSLPHPEATAPILYLDSIVSQADATPGGSSSSCISPHALRRRVAALLTGSPPVRPHSRHARTEAPFVPAAAAAVLRRAMHGDLPVFIEGEPGSGQHVIARSLHTSGGPGPYLLVNGNDFFSRCDRSYTFPKGTTLHIHGIEKIDLDAQEYLLDLLSTGPDTLPNRPRLVTSATATLDALVEDGRFSSSLYYQIRVLAVRLPPLRERQEDILPLARLLADELCTRLGRPAVTFSNAALDRLRAYQWFGNLAELESVLARTLTLCDAESIEARDLLFDGDESSLVVRETKQEARVSGLLELVLSELAHELKNPMVTLKTFAHVVGRSREAGDDAARMAELTGQAVDRMDSVLERLLSFARFRAPRRKVLPLATLLSPVLSEAAEHASASGGSLAYNEIPRLAIYIDPDQAGFALTGILNTLAAAGGRVDVQEVDPNTVSFCFSGNGRSAATRLTDLVEDDTGDALPLGLALARVLFERNGGGLTLNTAEGTPTVTLRFAPVPEGAQGDD